MGKWSAKRCGMYIFVRITRFYTIETFNDTIHSSSILNVFVCIFISISFPCFAFWIRFIRWTGMVHVPSVFATSRRFGVNEEIELKCLKCCIFLNSRLKLSYTTKFNRKSSFREWICWSQRLSETKIPLQSVPRFEINLRRFSCSATTTDRNNPVKTRSHCLTNGIFVSVDNSLYEIGHTQHELCSSRNQKQKKYFLFSIFTFFLSSSSSKRSVV